MKKFWEILVTSALLACSSVALALPFNSFDPRSMAMGGAGVAVGDASMAPFFNPALLTVTREEDDFSMDLPIVGARAYDPSDFVTSLDNFQKGKYVDTMDTLINAYNNPTGQNSANLYAIAGNASTLSTQFTTLSDKPLQGELGLGMVIGVPSKSFGAAFYANGWGALGGVIKYRDEQLLQGFIAMSTTVADTLLTGCGGAVNNSPGCVNALLTMPIPDTDTNPLITTNQYFTVDATNPLAPSVTSNFNSNNLQSSVDMRGVVMSEVGLALSHEYGSGSNAWGFGITPKIVRATLFDYSADVNVAKTSKSTNEDYTAKYSSVNFDLGLAKDYGNGWRSGFVVKNVIPQNYDFKRIRTGDPSGSPQITTGTMKLKPQARIGVSHSNSWSTAAMDLDLTANDPAGLENKSQYLALGGELNAWDWAQVRVGYRANLKDSVRNVTSVGLGLGPFDLTVAGSSNELGASFAFGFTF